MFSFDSLSLTEPPMLLVLGVVLLLSIALQALSSRIRLPTISLLLLLGLAIGPSGLDVLPTSSDRWFTTSADVALAMIGFLLGGEFGWKPLRRRGARAVVLSLGLALGTALVVALALRAVGLPWSLCLLLGGIAPATDPAATVAVLEELGDSDEFSDTLRKIVALDDVWGVLVFGLMLAFAGTLETGVLDVSALVHGLAEIGGSILLGAVLGGGAAPLTARIVPGRPTLLEGLGLVLCCVGASRWLGMSPLLASVAMGAALTNLARHHSSAFRSVKNIEWPFLVVFFVLAGASFDLRGLSGLGLAAGVYLVARVVGRFVGIGAAALPRRECDARTLLWTPLALLPQAGVALGLALSTTGSFPQHASTIMNVTVVGTLVFEVVGPVVARFAVTRSRASS